MGDAGAFGTLLRFLDAHRFPVEAVPPFRAVAGLDTLICREGRIVRDWTDSTWFASGVRGGRNG